MQADYHDGQTAATYARTQHAYLESTICSTRLLRVSEPKPLMSGLAGACVCDMLVNNMR